MPHAVSRQQVRFDALDTHFAAEASTLGLPPGEWPLEIAVEDLLFLRNVQAFEVRCGELVAVHYHTVSGRTLKVYND